MVLQDNKIIEINSWIDRDGDIGIKMLILTSDANLKELTIPKLSCPNITTEYSYTELSGELNFKIKPVNGVLLELSEC